MNLILDVLPLYETIILIVVSGASILIASFILIANHIKAKKEKNKKTDV